jgi:signal recognition particle receptor subunit beta
MVLFNYSTRELTAKIVYYGPGLCGKTTNLQFIYESLPDNVKKGKMLSLATKTDRTLFFDFLPIELGSIRGMKTRVQLYTVPGQVFYNSTRKLVLKGADGVVFVADSQSKMLEANGESYKNLEDNLSEMGIRLEEIPLVMQFNKRDLPNLSSVEEMNTQINRHNAPFYEAVATTGIGVEDTLKAITKLVLNNLATKYKLDGATASAEEPAPAPPLRRPVAAAPRKASSASGGSTVRGAPPPPSAAPAAARASRPAQEDLALEELEIDLEAPAAAGSGPASPPSPVVSEPQAASGSGFQPLGEELINLDEEIDLQGLDDPPEGTIDLAEDLLQELEEEPEPVTAGSQEAPTAGARPVALRAVPQPDAGGDEAPLELDDPIDLGEESWEGGPAGAEASASPILDIGPISPGQDRVIEVPVSATVDGRSVRLNLRVTVRLNR